VKGRGVVYILVKILYLQDAGRSKGYLQGGEPLTDLFPPGYVAVYIGAEKKRGRIFGLSGRTKGNCRLDALRGGES